MKKKLLILFLLFVSGSLFSLDSGLEILDYSFSGIVNADESIDVKEDILLHFSAEKHGLVREISLKALVWRKVKGVNKEFIYHDDIKNIAVFENGKPASYSLRKDRKSISLKIGSYDKTYLNEDVRYQISYKIIVPADRVKESDYFFYSVLGDEWDIKIRNFSFNLLFNRDLQDEIDFYVHSGPYGSEKNVRNIKLFRNGNSISGACDFIKAGDCISVFAELPEGFFENNYKEPFNKLLLIPFASVAFSLFIIIFALNVKKEKPVQTVEFYPPDDISSAEIGYIIDESADDVDLLSLIPLWAEKGYIQIQEKTRENSKKSYLILFKKVEQPLLKNEYEKRFWNALFYNRNERKMDNLELEFAEKFTSAKASLKKNFSQKPLYKGSGFANLLYFVNLVFFFLTLVFLNDDSIAFGFALVYGIPFMFFLGVTMTATEENNLFFAFRAKRKKTLLFILTLFLSFVAVFLVWTDDSNYPGIYALFSAFVLPFVNLFKCRFVSPTEYNLSITGRLLGFKDFIEKAEIEKLRNIVLEDPEYFYKILPYSMVFKLSDKWSEKFMNINIHKPDWYRSDSRVNIVFTPLHYNSMISNNISHSVSQVKNEYVQSKRSQTSASSHFSSGGHGFSGGGHGGGGGHGW